MKKKIVKGTIVILLVVVAAVYGIGYWRCTNYFAKQTVVDHVDIGGQSMELARELLDEKLSSYSLTVIGRDTTDVITAEELSMYYEDMDETLSELLSGQQSATWFLNTILPEQTALDIGYDMDRLKERIAGLSCMTAVPVEPEDAYVTYEDGEYQVVPQVEGNILDKEAASRRIMEAVDSMKDEVSLLEDYESPEITSESKEITDLTAQLDKMLSAKITITDGNHTEVIDRSVIKDFIAFQDRSTVILDSERIRQYVNKHFDPGFDTIGKSRTVKGAQGEKLTVSGGNYGQLVDTLGEVEQLTKEITEGQQVEREPVCKQKEVSEKNGGIGSTFIEVDIASQTLWLVQDGKVTLETPVVTGDVSKNRKTPTGVYYVSLKARDYTMKTYGSFVHYWMPFDQIEGVGFHDASWRNKFGGNIYQHSGSHGCVNMPSEAAKQLYEQIEVGIPVVVH